MLTQESSSKRAGDKLDQGRSKKQKVKDDKEEEELKRCLEIIPYNGDDVTINATPLSIKTLIIDYMIYKEGEEERNDDNNIATVDDIEKPTRIETRMPVKEAKKENKYENGIKNEQIRKAGKEEMTEAPSSQPVEYYLKHRINKKLIDGLIDNHRKKITMKEDIRGNFKIPCNIKGLKHMNALVDQGSNVNVMPLYTYKKLTDERPAETNIRLSLASHSCIYPSGIEKDVLLEVAKNVYPVDFIILDIKENKKRPFIFRTPFLTTTKAVIKFDKGTITLRSGKSKISFNRMPESLCKDEKGIKNDIEHIAPTMTVNRLVLKWEEKIKLHQEKEMEFD
nr:hypothetical protein [Tanacetum cinerariifolium]